MAHATARLTVFGRDLIVQRVREGGWSAATAAEASGVSRATVYKWLSRFDAEGSEGLQDRSSRPLRSPRRVSRRLEDRILRLRRRKKLGPHRLATRLGVPRSTCYAVLKRHQLQRLDRIDRPTGEPIRRYEWEKPGDLVHVDTKKLARIPPGGGHRKLGRDAAPSHTGCGYEYVHSAVDDHSRLAYSEILNDEKKETAASFWSRAKAWFEERGVEVTEVMTDNGSCYRSRLFAANLGGVIHRKTRPYRPQTNGKVERFNRTMLEEWAYVRPYTTEAERVAAFEGFLHLYNHHRGHTALGGKPPISRVNDLLGQYT